MLRTSIPLLILFCLTTGVASAAQGVSHDDFKVFLETRDALADERVQKMPEAKRLSAIAQRNFKMKAGSLQAILDRVEAAGGEKDVAIHAKEAVTAAVSATELKARLKSVEVDTSSPHVVTYVTWQVADEKKIPVEAALLAVKAGVAAPITSTFYFVAKDPAGAIVWKAKLGADRTAHIREERIADWATTRYLKLFEVEHQAQ